MKTYPVKQDIAGLPRTWVSVKQPAQRFQSALSIRLHCIADLKRGAFIELWGIKPFLIQDCDTGLQLPLLLKEKHATECCMPA